MLPGVENKEQPQKPQGDVWTRHGYPVFGVTSEAAEQPPTVSCGGPAICNVCQTDINRIQRQQEY